MVTSKINLRPIEIKPTIVDISAGMSMKPNLNKVAKDRTKKEKKKPMTTNPYKQQEKGSNPFGRSAAPSQNSPSSSGKLAAAKVKKTSNNT